MTSQYAAMVSKHANPLMDVLFLLREVIQIYQTHGEGKLLVLCAQHTNNQSSKTFRVSVCGSLLKAFIFSEVDLGQYLLQRGSPDCKRQMEPFFYIERCLLQILKGSGWGEISIEFEKVSEEN
ncbi:MAG: hypothetical protein HC790_12405 [Acaryochloridaceae cyanobacterium CSU_3_4]|nr:hypothetical protein [Acaryochloridaceae cyanobacterium CSU_3_4]